MFALSRSSKHKLFSWYRYIWYVDLAVVVLTPGSSPGNDTGDEKCCYIVPRSPEHILVWGTNFVLLSGSLRLTALRIMFDYEW